MTTTDRVRVMKCKKCGYAMIWPHYLLCPCPYCDGECEDARGGYDTWMTRATARELCQYINTKGKT